jgi:hypothetical protein
MNKVRMCGVLQHVPGFLIQPEHLMKYNRHVTNVFASTAIGDRAEAPFLDNLAIPTSRATQYLTLFQLLNNK